MISARSWGRRVLTWRHVPLDYLRHDDKAVHRMQGLARSPVQRWPLYRFYCMYLDGQEEAAIEWYGTWLLAMYTRYEREPKHRGGYYRGTLYQTVHGDGRGRPSTMGEGALLPVIYTRLQDRLALLDSLRSDGYVRGRGDAPVGVRLASDQVILRNGHHRCAAWAALGHETWPEVVVWPIQAVEAVYRLAHGSLSRKSG